MDPKFYLPQQQASSSDDGPSTTTTSVGATRSQEHQGSSAAMEVESSRMPRSGGRASRDSGSGPQATAGGRGGSGNLRGGYKPWSQEEDDLLRKLVDEHGPTNWPEIASHLEGRTSKSCRLRWVNQLRDDLHVGPFTAEEDDKIVKLQAIHGNKWSTIAQELSGRTDNMIKNRWNSYLKKKIDTGIAIAASVAMAASLAAVTAAPAGAGTGGDAALQAAALMQHHRQLVAAQQQPGVTQQQQLQLQQQMVMMQQHPALFAALLQRQQQQQLQQLQQQQQQQQAPVVLATPAQAAPPPTPAAAAVAPSQEALLQQQLSALHLQRYLQEHFSRSMAPEHAVAAAAAAAGAIINVQQNIALRPMAAPAPAPVPQAPQAAATPLAAPGPSSESVMAPGDAGTWHASALPPAQQQALNEDHLARASSSTLAAAWASPQAASGWAAGQMLAPQALGAVEESAVSPQPLKRARVSFSGAEAGHASSDSAAGGSSAGGSRARGGRGTRRSLGERPRSGTARGAGRRSGRGSLEAESSRHRAGRATGLQSLVQEEGEEEEEEEGDDELAGGLFRPHSVPGNTALGGLTSFDIFAPVNQPPQQQQSQLQQLQPQQLPGLLGLGTGPNANNGGGGAGSILGSSDPRTTQPVPVPVPAPKADASPAFVPVSPDAHPLEQRILSNWLPALQQAQQQPPQLQQAPPTAAMAGQMVMPMSFPNPQALALHLVGLGFDLMTAQALAATHYTRLTPLNTPAGGGAPAPATFPGVGVQQQVTAPQPPAPWLPNQQQQPAAAHAVAPSHAAFGDFMAQPGDGSCGLPAARSPPGSGGFGFDPFASFFGPTHGSAMMGTGLAGATPSELSPLTGSMSDLAAAGMEGMAEADWHLGRLARMSNDFMDTQQQQHSTHGASEDTKGAGCGTGYKPDPAAGDSRS